MSIQNIMNVCFAICITFLIFQNQQLKDQADTLEGFAQLDVDTSSERLDEIEQNHNTLIGYVDLVAERVNFNDDELTKLFSNFDITQERDEKRKEGLRALVEQVEKNGKNIAEVLDFMGDLHNLK